MLRIQTLICSGVCFLICTFVSAQTPPKKNASIQQVVGYQVYQQKQWNYNQLPKKSIQYKLDPKYVPLGDRRNSQQMKLNITPVAMPQIEKSFPSRGSSFHTNSRSYLQSSRFLKYKWLKK